MKQDSKNDRNRPFDSVRIESDTPLNTSLDDTLLIITCRVPMEEGDGPQLVLLRAFECLGLARQSKNLDGDLVWQATPELHRIAFGSEAFLRRIRKEV